MSRSLCSPLRPLVLAALAALPPPLAAAEDRPPASAAPGGTDDYGDPLPEGAVARLGRSDGRGGGRVESLAFSPDGRLLAAGGPEVPVRVFDVASRRVLFDFETPGIPAFSPDGATLAAASTLGAVTLVSPAGWSVRGKLYGHEEGTPIRAAVFWRGGRALATAGADGTVRLWDVERGRETAAIRDGALSVQGVALLAAGEALVLALSDTRLTLRTLPDGEPEAAWEGAGDDLPIGPLAAFPDGGAIAARTGARLRIWEAASGREVACLPGPFPSSWKPAASPDGRSLAVPGDEAAVRVFDLAAGAERFRIEAPGLSVASAAFSPDGGTLATGCNDGSIVLWPLVPAGSPAGPAGRLDPGEAERLWDELVRDDAVRAYRAVSSLAAAGDAAVAFLRGRLRPADAGPERLAALLADLDADDFPVREAATESLAALGDAAAQALREAARDRPSPEIRARARSLLDALDAGGAAPRPRGEALRGLRAVEALERIGTASAGEALASLAAGHPDAPPTRAARAALQRLEGRLAR